MQIRKPPYRVPTMAEIRDRPWNGYTVCSTFAGCGGSSTGYRMAGFKVLYANEFIPAAAETYRANAHPGTIVDETDIRRVSGVDILKATGLRVAELDVLDGSPPCSAFSTAGKREAGWGKAKSYSDGAVQVVDDLFFEYARLVDELQPRVFVAENVSGLVKGTAKGYFKRILAALREPGYRVEARLLDAQWLGVPQARQRLIFVGVRDDLDLAAPAHPLPLPYRYTIRDALAGVSKADTSEVSIGRYAIGKEWHRIQPGTKSEKYLSLVRPSPDAPCPTVTAKAADVTAASVTHPTECRKFTLPELRRICGFPDDFALTGGYEAGAERLGRAVPPVMMSHIAATVSDKILVRL
jgi:DNA (cytosine-5)-methyltransferase 1